MSWDPGKHSKVFPDTVNCKWENLQGDLTVDQAQDWLVKYLCANPAAAAKLLIGQKKGVLRPIQDTILRIWFKRNTNMLIAGRGFSKSYTAAIFITLYAILHPGVKIGIFSASFRQAKLIFEQIENFIKEPDAIFLQQCLVGEIKHGTDCHTMKLGNSIIKALPLTAKVRGERFSLIVIDEYLSVPENLIKEIVDPMTVVKPGNTTDNDKIKRYEDRLVERGEMKEWERTSFIQSKKLMLSSASYETDSLYKETYMGLLDSIHDKNAENVNYSICRLSYKFSPKGQLDDSVVADAKKNLSKAQFDREYMAIFTKETDRFYSRKDILAATAINPDREPVITIKGNPSKDYILAIDPQFSAGSEDADNFAMAVLEMNGEVGTLVHAYALAKSHSKNRAIYFKYLLDNFNIKLIVLDNAGGPRFLQDFEAIMPNYEGHPKLIEIDMSSEEGFQQTKYNYNYSARQIAISVIFNKDQFIRNANESLQSDIQHKRIMFGLRTFLSPHHTDLNLAYDIGVKMDDLEFRNMDQSIAEDVKRALFIETVEETVEKTKDELVLIEMTSTITGGYTFDLPKSVRRRSGKDRARRDSYTALLLANYGRNIYVKMNSSPIVENFEFNGTWVN